jgi:hypothetical protein
VLHWARRKELRRGTPVLRRDVQGIKGGGGLVLAEDHRRIEHGQQAAEHIRQAQHRHQLTPPGEHQRGAVLRPADRAAMTGARWLP